MKLRSSLSIMFLACGLTPLVVATIFNYFVARNNMEEFSHVSKEHLVKNTEQLLSSVQQAKADQVKSLVGTISDQAVAFSKNPATIQACREFTRTFGKADFIQNATSQQLSQVDAALQDYYSNQFGASYKEQNEGQTVDANSLLSKLSTESKLMQYEYIAANPNPLGEKDKLVTPDTPSEYNSLHEKYHPAFRDYLNRFGYYDIFICDTNGRIVYSVFKELDYGTSLTAGPYAGSNLAGVFRQALTIGDADYALSDFRPYTPSYSAPACFTGSPIVEDGKVIGAAIFQIPVAKVNEVMTNRTGLGDGGESYLVGPDSIMRSDSFLDPANRSLSNAFKNPANAKVETEAAKLALSGKSGFLGDTKNYLDQKVLSSYGQVSVGGLNWGMVTDMPYDEALAAVNEMQAYNESANFWYLLLSGIGVAVVSVVIGGLAYYLSGRIVAPIQQVVNVTHAIAEGDLSARLPVDRKDEIGELSSALNQALDKLSDSIGRISKSAHTLNGASRTMTAEATALSSDVSASRSRSQHVAASSQELSGTIHGMSASAEQMTASMQTVAASVEEMTQTIAEIASNAERSATVAKEASELATVSNAQISDLGSAADEIGKVIEVIQDIAEQTNLLALNATIEAARAGEAGKGFAVVATEVKELAKQTGAATDDIRQRIEGIQNSTSKAVASIREISEVVGKVNMVASTIASAVEEQNVTTKEMARHISETALSAEGVSSAVSSTSRATEDISSSITEVDEVIGRTVIAANGSEQQGTQLLAMAEEMLQQVSQFKLSSILQKS